MSETLKRQYEKTLRDNARLTAEVAELEGAIKDGVAVLDDLAASRVDDEVLASMIDITKAVKDAAKRLLKRPSNARGPFNFTDADLEKIIRD